MITVEGLGKEYHFVTGPKAGQHHTLRDAIVGWMRAIIHCARPRANASASIACGRHPARENRFWALRDVSFAVGQGEVLGIIGRNGAGKSTLLKILGRITEPTEGRAQLRGRVASLLEVGTGFHPELSGRENIYLNGAILGMTRAEIRSRFDEIVAFAEVEGFLDMPVKRYSSGMYVRLAFAVAAHLEPEILIIDEVLAVGDLGFQRKCLGKMQSVRRSGRTVLFVSHNLAAVQSLCDRAVYLNSGRLQAVGPAVEIVRHYLRDGAGLNRPGPVDFLTPAGLRVVKFEVHPNPAPSRGSLCFRVRIESELGARVSEAALLVHSADGTRVAIVDLRECGLPHHVDPGGHWSAEGTLRHLPFVEGDYRFGLYIVSGTFEGNLHDLVTLTVTPAIDKIKTPYPAAQRGFIEFDVAFQPQDDTPGPLAIKGTPCLERS